MENDKEFWKKIKEGDQAALGAIYERYSNVLYAYGMKIVQDRELINDCIQDLFVYLYDKRKNLSIPSNVKAYLLLSLKRQIYKAKMDEAKTDAQFVSIDNMGTSDRTCFNLIIDVQATMEYTEFKENQLRSLQEALDGLSPRQREILYLRYYKKLSLDEVMEVTKISRQVVMNMTSIALSRLRQNELLTKTFLLELLAHFTTFVNLTK